MGNMTLIQAILCGIVYWLAVGNLPFVGLWSLQRPLVCGTLVGGILGHPVEGAVIGATINLVYEKRDWMTILKNGYDLD